MPYSQFETIEEVADKFDIEVTDKNIIKMLEIEIAHYPFSEITNRLQDSMSFINETTICEDIIKPILLQIKKQYSSLYIWSHVAYNVDKDNGLFGEPDYLIAARAKHGGMNIPPLCIMEAKKENWDKGWAQTLAEMYAASTQGAATCYGVVTTGKAWEFGQLHNKIFAKDPNHISATDNLQKVFDILNWLFNEVDKIYT
ncbi:hypothetical protein TI05_07325 [Achromatium sp. WMS3]|nr:hypothetical protein TI05_07325 [Achromatium sp. WMS3]